jgi:hypothetical protein
MKSPDTPMVRQPGLRIIDSSHNTRSLSQPTAPPQQNSQARLLSAAQLRLLEPVRFCSGLSEAFLSGCPPLVPDVDAP